MNRVQVINVLLNGLKVGQLAVTPDKVCAFEYDSGYLLNGTSISPYYLPLKPGLFIADASPFNGNFGVLDDSLPDGWGNLILDRYLLSKKINPATLSIPERLSIIGSSGRGALEYLPQTNLLQNRELQDIEQLSRDAQELLSDSENFDLESLFLYGGSSGGARPKVFYKENEKEWLIKFKASTDPENIGEIEYKYSLLAKKVGITMPHTRFFNDKYFGTERFDRGENCKIHTVSAAGLLNADYRIPCLDYSTLLKVTLNLTKDMSEVMKMFRLMVFNVVIMNRDDHAKNFSFQLINGNWKLSPAYDLLPGAGFGGEHTTSINGQGFPKLADIIKVASGVGINKSKVILNVEEITDICFENKLGKYCPK